MLTGQKLNLEAGSRCKISAEASEVESRNPLSGREMLHHIQLVTTIAFNERRGWVTRYPEAKGSEKKYGLRAWKKRSRGDLREEGGRGEVEGVHPQGTWGGNRQPENRRMGSGLRRVAGKAFYRHRDQKARALELGRSSHQTKRTARGAKGAGPSHKRN